MPSNDVVLTNQYCHDPIWNSLQGAVDGQNPENVLAIFRAVIAIVTFEFIKDQALLEDVRGFTSRENQFPDRGC